MTTLGPFDGTSLTGFTDRAIGSAMQVTGGIFRQTTASTNAAVHNDTALAVPHWAQADAVLSGASDCIETVMVRVDTGALTWYQAGLDRTAGAITAKIMQIAAGVSSDLITVATTAVSGNIRLYATGTSPTVLTLAIDGVQVLQFSDSTSPFSTQTRVGMLAGGAIGSLDNFLASDVATAPLAPTGITVIPSDRSLVVSWTAPFDGMAAITDYVIEYSTNGTSWTTFSEGTSTAVTTTITGLTNGTPYFVRVSATNSTGTGTPGTSALSYVPVAGVSFIGAGVQAVSTTSGGNVLADFPAGYTVQHGDIALLHCAGLHNTGSTLAPSAPSGYTQLSTRFQDISTYDLQVTVFRRVLQTGDSAPNVVVPAAYSTTSGGLSAYMLVFRNADQTTPEDATTVVSSGAAAASFTPTGITTVTEGAMVVSLVASADDNALGHLAASDQGFTIAASGANYDTTTGGDHAIASSTRSGAIQALTTQAAAPAHLTAVDNTAGTAYNYRWTGSGVTVFIIGGGIRGTHNEFTSRLGTGYAVAAASGADPFTDGTLVNVTPGFPEGHDTGVASVAMGTTYGIAKGATIYPITMITSAESTASNLTLAAPAARIIDALNHVASVGIPGRSVVIFSNIGIAAGETDYLGGTFTAQNVTDITDAFRAVVNKGIPCVIAAGNQANDTYIAAHTPMNMPEVITVGNLDAVTGAKSTTSNFGSGITIWAPGSGTGTDSAAATSNSAATGAFDGTSEAAPVVAGVIALLMQAHPFLSSAQIKQILLNNALTAAGSVGTGSTTKLVNSLYMPDGSIGASICPTWSETAVGNDAWAAITVALRPATLVYRRPDSYGNRSAVIRGSRW